MAARRRRYLLAARIALFAAGGGVLLSLIVGGIISLAPSRGSSVETPDAEPVTLTGTPTKAGRARTRSATARAGIQPSIAEGRTGLGEGVYAERAGDSVIVHFDTPELRTRFDWKFEGVVRATLPLVFPQAADALGAIPQATLVHGSLLNDLPVRGIRLPLGSGSAGALTIWPVTRPGDSGPLVVGYRVRATR